METNGNGEKLQVTVGGKSFGLQTRDLISVLLLLILAGGGYVLLEHQAKQLDHMTELLYQHTSTLLEAVHEQRAFSIKQAQDDRMAVRHMLIIHDYNMKHPLESGLPIDLPPELLKPAQ